MQQNISHTNMFSFFKHTCPSFKKSDVKLQDVWKFYDEPYGLSIPIKVANDEECVYFVPHLSGIQLYQQDSLLFELFENAKPDQRMPLIDKMESLIQDEEVKRILWDMNVNELNWRKSWFCIAWYPILCHHYTMNHLRGGQILTLHSFELMNTFLHPKFVKSNYYSRMFFYLPIQGCLPYKVKEETWFEQVVVPPTRSSRNSGSFSLDEEVEVEKKNSNSSNTNLQGQSSTTNFVKSSINTIRSNQMYLIKGFQLWVQNHQLKHIFCDHDYIHAQQYYLFKN